MTIIVVRLVVSANSGSIAKSIVVGKVNGGFKIECGNTVVISL